METPKVKVTGFRIIANRMQFMRAEVRIDGKPAYVFADFEKGIIKVSWQRGQLELTMDAYYAHDGDFCHFLSHTLTQRFKEGHTT